MDRFFVLSLSLLSEESVLSQQQGPQFLVFEKEAVAAKMPPLCVCALQKKLGRGI